ncbi:hypothetical protein LTR10_005969 [Elasticomyces elasticus]|nr:hypothetical protein LTR10_005969 [Elasticomyces elasticus]
MHLQNEIGTLERQLDAWDNYVTKQPKGYGNNSSMAKDLQAFPDRPNIIGRLVPLVQQYNDHVLSFARVRALPTASKHHVENLETWFANYPESVAPSERHDVNNHGDLFPVVPVPKSPLFSLLERWEWLRNQFQKGDRSDHLGLSEESHWSDTAFDTLATFLMVILGLTLLYAPIWWLNYVSSHEYQLGVVTGFSSLFTLCLWGAAGNRPFEILAGVAAYSAVLMIYRQVSNSGS